MIIMHQSEIREICYKCGHHDLKAMEDSQFRTDYCLLAKEPCSTISTCDPACRTPKKSKWDLEKGRRKDKRHRIKKEALDHFVTPDDPQPDPDDEQERDPPLDEGDQGE